MSAIARDQRFTRYNPCPVCAGCESDKRGRGERCTGFLSDDGHYAHCTREEYAGDIRPTNARPPTYAHRLDGPCRCGETHGAAPLHLLKREPKPPRQEHLHTTPTEIYTEGYEPLRKLRYGSGKGKYFVWQHPDAAGQWWNCSGCDHERPGLYRAGDLLDADPWEPVFVVEGERKADALHKNGAIAVSPPDGAGSWREEFADHLAGRQVVIVQDPNDAGRTHANDAAASLTVDASTVRILEVDPAGDVYDWLTQGHSIAELRRLAFDAPIISARMAKTQNPCPKSHLDFSSNPNVVEWRRRKWERDLLANADLAMSHKGALSAIKDQLVAEGAQGEEPVRVNLGDIAVRYGVSAQTASDHAHYLAKQDVITCDTRWTTNKAGMPIQAVYIGRRPLLETPALITPETPRNGHGGARAGAGRKCKSCGSDHLTRRTSIVCLECGSVEQRPDVLVNPPSDDAPTTDTPTSPPESIRVNQDDSLGMNSGLADAIEAPIADVETTEEVPDGAGHVVHNYQFLMRGAKVRFCTICKQQEPERPGFTFGYRNYA
jgi:hypothetical protein